jgi:ComF family protein
MPPLCPYCDGLVAAHGQLCAACWNKFNWIGDPKCDICGYPFPANIHGDKKLMCPVCAAGKNELDWLRSACVYDDVSKNIMLPFKHAGRLQYKTLMARAMISALRGHPEFDVVMPVPLANRRLWKRGYNQAAILAKIIARDFQRPVDYDSVRRAHRPDMGHKNAAARAANIRGVFTVAGNVRGLRILLVDDVMTTGATFSELRRVLKRAGAAAVYGVSFCRVVRAI